MEGLDFGHESEITFEEILSVHESIRSIHVAQRISQITNAPYKGKHYYANTKQPRQRRGLITRVLAVGDNVVFEVDLVAEGEARSSRVLRALRRGLRMREELLEALEKHRHHRRSLLQMKA